MYSAGTAYLTVVPSFKGIEKAFADEARRFGQAVEASLGDAMRNASGNHTANGERDGDEYGKAYARKVREHLDEATKIKVDADTDPFTRAVRAAKEDLALLRDARIGVDLDTAGFFEEIARIKAEVEALDGRDINLKLKLNAAKVMAELRAIQALRDEIERRPGSLTPPSGGDDPSHRDGADADTDSANKKLDALAEKIAALNKAKILVVATADITSAMASIATLSSAVGQASALRIEIQSSVDTTVAKAALTELGKLVAKLNGTRARINVLVLDVPAKKALRGLETQITALSGKSVKIGVSVNDSAAKATLKALAGEIRKLDGKNIKMRVDLNSSAARAALKTLQGQLAALNGKNIKIDVKINTAAAIAALNALKTLVNELDGKTIKITIDLDGGAATRTALLSISRAAKRLDGKTIKIDIDVTGAAAAIASLTALLALARSIRSSLPVLPSGLGSSADAAGFGLSRLGAIIALVVSLGTALVPIGAAVAASISAIATAATAAVAGLGVFVLGIFGVIKAVTAMSAAEKDRKKAAKSNSAADNQVANALDGVRDAHENLQRTREDVARGAKRAARAVVDAHRSVIDAEKEALKAEHDLLRAKQEAQRQDEDRAFSIRDNALAQRQANLDIAESKKELDKVLHNPRATKAEREEAQIAYEERLLQMDQLKSEGQRLEEDKQRIAKEGADVVVSAQERVEQATDNVARAQRDLADAIEEQTQQRADGDRQLRDSQQAVIRSQRALQQAYMSSATAGGEAMNNLKEAMDALSPAGQRFAKFLFGLKKDFKDLQTAAETGMLPGLQKAIEAIVPYFPAIKNFVKNVAVALGDAFILIANTLKDPVWQTWFSYIGQTAGPTLIGMVQFLMDVLTGITGVFNALTGFNAPIGKGLLEWSAMFREWGSNLGTNSHFQKFIGYVKESAPVVLHFFGTLWEFLKRIVIASAPIGVVVLAVLTKVFEWINKIPIDVLTIIIATIVGVGTAFLVMGAVMLAVAGGTTAAVVAIIAVGAALWTLAYVKIKPFHDYINLLGRAMVWLWEKAIKPAFEAIGKAAAWLWERAIKPGWTELVWWVKKNLVPLFMSLWDTLSFVFKELGKAAMVWWNYLLKPIFLAVVWVVEKILAPIFMWLWKHVISPVLDWIGVAFRVVWAIIQVIFGLIMIALKIVGLSFMFLWTYAVKPTFDLIAKGVKALWDWMRPFTNWLAKVWKEDIGPALSWFGNFLTDIWDGVVKVLKIAVVWVVETLMNDGFLAAYNWLAKKFGVKPDDVKITMPASFTGDSGSFKGKAPRSTGGANNTHFAQGGHVTGPGGPRDDLIQAWLSNGEYVIPANVVGNLGVDYFDNLIGRRKGRTESARPGAMYAEGGFISFMRSAWDKITDPLKFLREQADKLIARVPGGELAKKFVVSPMANVITTIINKVKGWLSGGSSGSSAGSDFGAGPGFPPWPRSPGASRGDSGVWRSIVALIKSTGPMSGQFGNGYRDGDPLWHGSGRAVDWMGFNQDALASWLSVRKPLELIHRTDRQDFAFTRGVDKGSFNETLMQQHRNHIHIAMDSGGWLLPGMSHIWNGTGSPEAVLTGQQWSTLEQNISTNGGHAERHVTYNFRDSTLDASRLRAHENAEAARARYDRAR